MQEHWRVCTTLKDGRMVLQKPHFASIRDCTQYLIMAHERGVTFEGERVDFVRDFDSRNYPLWRIYHGI